MSCLADNQIATKDQDQSTPSRNLIEEQVQLGTRCNLTDLRCEQTSNKNVTKERDQLRIAYTNLIQEQDQLQTSYKNMTEERDQLKTSNSQLIQIGRASCRERV